MLKHLITSSVSLIGFILLIGVALAAQGHSPPLLSDMVREVKQETTTLSVYLQIRILPAIALVEAQAGWASVAKSTFEQALTLGIRYKEQQLPEGVRYLLGIAEHQHKAGQEAAAKATIAQAVELAQVLDNDPEGITRLHVVAGTQARMGDRAGVAATFARLREVFGSYMSSVEVAAIRNIVEVFMNQGKRQVAQAMMHELVSGKTNWETREMAVVFAKLGEVETTEKILEKVFKAQKTVQANEPHYNLFVNTETMLKVTEGFWEAGKDLAARAMLRKALREIEKIKDQTTAELFDQIYGPYHIWPKVAVLHAKFGNLQDAQRTLTQISIDDLKMEPLQAILEMQLQRGELEKARQTAHHPAIDLERVIEAQVRYGDVEGAKRSMDTFKKSIESNEGLQRYRTHYHIVEQPRDYQNVVRMVAKARITKGEYPETLEWARNQSTPDLKTYALLGVVEGMISKSQDE